MKILAFTSIRSDYDLMTPLYRYLDNDPGIDFRLIVSGAHLSKDFGYSVDLIDKDGFNILLKIETLLSSDSALSRVKSASLLMQNSLESIANFSPDLIVYAGDREDVLVYSMIGGYLNIPTVHFFGGDHAEDGYIDNMVRHATSKMSTAHFVSIEQHKKRLIRMGEESRRIFVTGSISLDKFVGFVPMPMLKIKQHLGIPNDLFDEFAILIFHPVTAELDNVDEYFENILSSLYNKGIYAFVGYPNVDPGNYKILNVIQKYRETNRFYFYKNLERNLFMSIYFQSKFIIGNSSSGICEAASLRKAAINVGLRQRGRFSDRNVVFTGTSYIQISDSIDLVLSDNFQMSLSDIKNSYGDGNSAFKAYQLLKTVNFKSIISKREDPLKVELL